MTVQVASARQLKERLAIGGWDRKSENLKKGPRHTLVPLTLDPSKGVRPRSCETSSMVDLRYRVFGVELSAAVTQSGFGIIDYNYLGFS